jgi:pSer/pThr/pTyr-binding forkhead associated (FHA) protein
VTGDGEKGHGAGPRPRLVGVTGPLRGEAVVLSRPRTVIGRDPAQCDLVLEPPVISRRHAAVEVDAAGRAFVIDLGSRGGTYVNGEQVTAAPRELREGDRLGLGAASAVSFTLPRGVGAGRGAAW